MEAKTNRYRSFKQIVNIFYNDALGDSKNTIEQPIQISKKIEITPQFIYDKIDNKIKLEVFIGVDKKYKIKKLSEFYDRMLKKENYKYGDKLEFIHTKEAFKEEYYPLLDFVLKYAEIIKYGNSNSNNNYRFGATALNESKIILDEVSIDQLFEILKGQTVKLQQDLSEKRIKLEPKNPNIKFKLEKSGEKEYIFYSNIDMLKTNILQGKDYTYLLIKNTLYRCDQNFEETTMKLLNAFKQNYSSKVKLGKEQLPELFSIIMPKIKSDIEIKEKDRTEIIKYLPKKVKARLYLDFDENNYLIANLKFVYDEKEYNPLEDEIKKQISRNIIEETNFLNILRKTEFMLDTKNLRFILTDNEKIYKFITDDIEVYMKNFEILATDNFNSKQIKQPKISTLGVKIENNLLELDLESLNIDTAELIEIMEKYRLKKKFHRLKDGTFLKLDNNEDIEFLNKLITGADVNYKELSTGIIRMPIHRTLYLNQLLNGLKGTTIGKNEEYKEVIDNLSKENVHEEIKIPFELEKTLRYYQKVGFKWLKTLDDYHFGGILADDMGLGKTIQVLSVIMSYVGEAKEKRKTSLVVAPSSLALNWKSEANKFTSELKILVISGPSFERKRQIENLNNYDLVITSYDLLKRDIEHYNEMNYQFKYIIADEAQYLKNSNTQNATSIKLLKADTRYALTGTPMENALSELWSIFDFIMPGYLFTYKKFKNLYEMPIVKEKDEVTMKKLKMLIEPFVLRRTKTQVLTELPEKTVTILTSNMQEEQKEIYLSYLARAKAEVKESIDINGFERSHMKILAVLTRLRQICCHPSVFIENYEGGSSKLEQCLELIKNGVESGHKILLFSGYTSMFPIIEEKLHKAGVEYFKLTGATKVNERIGLVEEFNNNEDIKVFLISLKAGGTGLNLTGADMVIHYDPWWNASAENQATDRAYRIGQKNNVQVYKLITKNSIEEKIYELQKNKSALIDNMLDINTSFVNKLSKDEIMELFE
ncbi:MAG: DEAD/DEAH box helicase [Clostridia bacterium]|nr:DEAD/DEAH box helicase [Clostridia bacterium]